MSENNTAFKFVRTMKPALPLAEWRKIDAVARAYQAARSDLINTLAEAACREGLETEIASTLLSVVRRVRESDASDVLLRSVRVGTDPYGDPIVRPHEPRCVALPFTFREEQ
jgi:hypothetical protein